VGMSGDSPSRRYDVVAETRRRWSDAEKRAVVREASGPSVNVSAVARRHGIKPSLLFRWKKLFPDAGATPTFTEVTLAAPPAPLPIAHDRSAPAAEPGRAPTAAAARADAGIEIALENGRRVRIGAGVDVELVVRIVTALEKRR
jgi:transposase